MFSLLQNLYLAIRVAGITWVNGRGKTSKDVKMELYEGKKNKFEPG
jgi:hypothetical protein